ncbi:MAG: CBS domain-containing protein [Nanoarchaeota archaeon]
MEITPAIKSEFLTFDSEQALSEMIGQLKKNKERQGLVFKKNKYVGVIEKKRLLRSRFDASIAKVGNHIHHTPIINEHDDIIETAYAMHQSDVDFLPVESDKKIVGVLSALDLAGLAVELPETKSYKVSDVKLVKPKALKKEDTVSSAMETMYKQRVDQVPVFEGGKLYGIVSFHDLLQRYLLSAPDREFSVKFTKMGGGSKSSEANRPNLAVMPISSFSTNQNIASVSKDSSLYDAVMQMKKENVSSLVVMNGKNVTGLLNLKSILKLIGSLKIPENFNIRFVGLNEAGLVPSQKEYIKKIASNNAFKLQRALHNDFSLVIHLKGYTKSDRERKYSVSLRIEYPGQVITATEYDWRVETALHKTFDNARNELQKKFKKGGRRTFFE